MSAPFFTHALAYAAKLDWRVFQTSPADARTPLKGEGFEHGVRDATRDPEELRRRFRIAPACNLALACGEGLLALDIDAKGAVDGFAALKRLEAEFAPLPATVRSRTPSGGAHLLFAFDGSSPPNRVGIKRWSPSGERAVLHGLDVRADGASIALPPSRRADGVYAWEASPFSTPLARAPNWLMALLRSEPPPRAPSEPLRLPTADRTARYVAAAVDRECSDLARCTAPGRNLRLFQAAANLGEFVGANVLPQDLAEAALERAAGECGLVGEDGWGAVRATIASGMRRGIAKPREIAA